MLLPLAVAFQLATPTLPLERSADPAAPAGGAPLRAPSATAAVYSGRNAATRVRAPRLETVTQVDGVLDEPVWRDAAILTGFTTYNPVDGRPAQDSTEVRIWYAPDAIHVGIRAWAPPGTVRATLAERDRISNDDWVAIHFDTFDDRRRSFVFGVNPLGVQADGMRSDQSAGPGVSRASLSAVDLTQDYIWQSKGRLLDDGYEVELRIPFKSLRYQAASVQRWGMQVIRQVQRSGFQETWAPVSRSNQAFALQAGYLEGLRDLRRGLVLDVTPTTTGFVEGTRSDGDLATALRYGARQQVGGDVRWGVTSNFTLNATANPDFSQVETDVGQIPGDVRFALFFPELRPFFVEGSEQFDAPNQLIYTRRIRQPVAAAKLTGKIPRTDVGLLMAMDNASASADGTTNPFFTILRLRRDLGTQSTAGLVYTDRVEGAHFNRVGGFDTRLQFNRVYSVDLKAVGSLTRDSAGTRAGATYEASTGRTGRSYGYRYQLQGFTPDFATQSGFVNRVDFVRGQVNQRWTRFGRKGGWWDQQQQFLTATWLWSHDGFRTGRAPLEMRAKLDNSVTIRGGWRAQLSGEYQGVGFDPRRYADYRTVDAATGDTVAFAPSARQHMGALFLTVNTPQWRRLGATVDVIAGREPEFFETATVERRQVDLSVDLRPTTQLRVGTLLRWQRFDRVRDGTLFSEQLVPRFRLEYQLSRALFVRFIGQLEARDRDALRDPRTGRAILAPDDDGVFAPVARRQSLIGRADWLVSYLPSPGTVVYVGYGAALDAQPTYRPGDFQRRGDGFFVRVSYLWRAGVGRPPAMR